MARIDFGIGIGIAGIVLGIIIVVLDKAGKLKGPWLLILLAVAGVMTLFIAVGNVWVLESPEKWKLWRGGLMIALVAFSYTGIGIWISSDSEPKEVTEKVAGAIAEKQPDSSKYGNLAQRTEDLSRDLRVYTEARKGGLHELLKRANAPDEKKAVMLNWLVSFADGYRAVYRQRVSGIQAEYAALHIRNRSLDELLDTEQGLETGRYAITAGPKLPVENEGFVTGVCGGLDELAQTLKQQ